MQKVIEENETMEWCAATSGRYLHEYPSTVIAPDTTALEVEGGIIFLAGFHDSIAPTIGLIEESSSDTDAEAVNSCTYKLEKTFDSIAPLLLNGAFSKISNQLAQETAAAAITEADNFVQDCTHTASYAVTRYFHNETDTYPYDTVFFAARDAYAGVVADADVEFIFCTDSTVKAGNLNSTNHTSHPLDPSLRFANIVGNSAFFEMINVEAGVEQFLLSKNFGNGVDAVLELALDMENLDPVNFAVMRRKAVAAKYKNGLTDTIGFSALRLLLGSLQPKPQYEGTFAGV